MGGVISNFHPHLFAAFYPEQDLLRVLLKHWTMVI